MNTFNNQKGSLLLGALISIVILFIIVSGSLYSYVFVHARFQEQLDQRKILSLAQGFMETALCKIDTFFQKNPGADLGTAEVFLEQYFNTSIKTVHPYNFVDNDQISLDIDFRPDSSNPNGNVIAALNLHMDQFGLNLYTEKYLEAK